MPKSHLFTQNCGSSPSLCEPSAYIKAPFSEVSVVKGMWRTLAAVKELKLSYHNPEAMLSKRYPYLW